MTRSVLIIDDEHDIRQVTQLSLELVAGWQVDTAADGPAGVAMARASAFDAILLDVMMPDLDGPGTLSLLREQSQSRDTPVIFITARAHPSDVQRLEALGALGVIAKPFDPMVLSHDVCALLGWSN